MEFCKLVKESDFEEVRELTEGIQYLVGQTVSEFFCYDSSAEKNKPYILYLYDSYRKMNGILLRLSSELKDLIEKYDEAEMISYAERKK